MSIAKSTKQQGSSSRGKGEQATGAVGSRSPRTKMLGTRVGTLSDWRGAGAKGGSERSQHGKRLRDGQ
jgi:hypothetical protein